MGKVLKPMKERLTLMPKAAEVPRQSRKSKAAPKLLGPVEERKVPEEIRFFPDSSEHIEESINRNGLRPMLEEAFRKAIERAAGKGPGGER